MKIRWTHIIAIICVLALLLAFKGCADAKKYKKLADQQSRNVEALINDVDHYRTKDSLSCAKVGELELSLRQAEKMMADEMSTIKQLSIKMNDVNDIGKVTTTTEYKIVERLKDTTIHVRDTVENVKMVEVEKPYYEVKAVVVHDTINIDVKSRDSLLIVETIKYKRFLGFLWKTKRIKSRDVDVVSKNPNTTIEDVQWITIKQ